MLPLVFPIAHVSVYVANIFIVFAWGAYSFLFWRGLRRWAIEEDRVFDLTFYSTLVAIVTARLGYVASHWELFAGKSMLLTAALWIAPGLSWLCGLIGGLATLILLSRQYKVRLGLVLDTLAVALPLPIIVGEIASLLDGLEIGARTAVPWSIRFVGAVGNRHPVQLYEMVALVIISFIIIRLSEVSVLKKWAYGMVGIWFFLLYSLLMFVLEFVKDSHVYWGRLTANQWILIGIFAECIGVIYVRGGGRESIRPHVHAVRAFLEEKGKHIYATVSKRHTR